MVEMYVRLVLDGKRTLEQVPYRYREEVTAIVKAGVEV